MPEPSTHFSVSSQSLHLRPSPRQPGCALRAAALWRRMYRLCALPVSMTLSVVHLSEKNGSALSRGVSRPHSRLSKGVKMLLCEKLRRAARSA